MSDESARAMTVKEYVLRRLNQGETDLKVLAPQTRIQIRDVLGLKPANLQRHRPEPAPSFFTLSKRKGLPHLSGSRPRDRHRSLFFLTRIKCACPAKSEAGARENCSAHGSHRTPRWREMDSNPRSPVRRITLFETPLLTQPAVDANVSFVGRRSLITLDDRPAICAPSQQPGSLAVE